MLETIHSNTPSATSFSNTESPMDIIALPPEIIAPIFSYLDNPSRNSLMQSHSLFYAHGVRFFRIAENIQINFFLESLAQALDRKKYQQEINLIEQLSQTHSVLNSVSLLMIKSNLQSIKNLLIFYLKTLSEADLTQVELILKPLPRPKILDDLFYLAKVHRSIEEAMSQEVTEKNYSLFIIANDLLGNSYLDMAISIAELIDQTLFGDIKNEIYESFAEKLLNKNAFDLAADFLIQQHDRLHHRPYFFVSVSNGLIQNNNPKKALQICQLIRCDKIKSDAMTDVIIYFCLERQLEEATRLALSIPDEEIKKQILKLLHPEIPPFKKKKLNRT